jgi:heptosyltransferase-2
MTCHGPAPRRGSVPVRYPPVLPRTLVIMPSWVGDAVMATPALRLLRTRLPGMFLGALVRPGIDQLLAGSDLLDEVHVERAAGVMGPKFAAGKVRPRRYEQALLLTNSFSTALIARIAGIPRRLGYNRDARGLLLTDRLEAPKTAAGRWAPIPAVSYYHHAAQALVGDEIPALPPATLPRCRLELGIAPDQQQAGDEVLRRAGIGENDPLIILNPGGNNPAKRWPAERFAAAGRTLAERHAARVLVNASPAEADLGAQIAREIGPAAASLAEHGITLGALKPIARRARLMITNDTGPRHIAAAFGTPVVSLFGPTDHRWTTIPTWGASDREAILLADPTLPESEVADDHPERCRVDRITLESVLEAAERLLSLPS